MLPPLFFFPAEALNLHIVIIILCYSVCCCYCHFYHQNHDQHDCHQPFILLLLVIIAHFCVTCCCPGKRCEYLTSLSFVHNNSFVELEPLRTKPSANVTMVFATEQENGVLLYDGQSEHLAVELFNGRIRVSYDVGNYPVSTMYRHVFSVS